VRDIILPDTAFCVRSCPKAHSMSRLNITILLAFSLAWSAFSHAEPVEKPFVWPNGARAAVSLTYDDAVPVHYRRDRPSSHPPLGLSVADRPPLE
jgi:hypothetical protein